jgi:hypothetical protein
VISVAGHGIGEIADATESMIDLASATYAE